MYNQLNLGDCFLLKFKDGRKECYMLIDFGSYFSGNEEREIEIAESIRDTVKKKPLIIVLTHQHKDHLSGFIAAAPIFKTMNIDEVWFSYLDDPNSEEGQNLRTATEKFWKLNIENRTKAAKKFKGVPEVEAMLEAKKSFDLFAEDQSGGEAISNLLQWSNYNCRFLLPGNNFEIPGLPEGTVRTYVLGPPTDEAMLRKLNPSQGDAVHGLNALMQLNNLQSSVQLLDKSLDVISPGIISPDDALNFPFNKKFSHSIHNETSVLLLQKKYEAEEQAWRRIDYDWLSELGRLSLHMDSLTNNSSLVLAFEMVKNKKVALFVGDAQIGNWKSWFNVRFEDSDKTAKDLLAKTVFYKAGHHSSHNATLQKGLDLMNENELVIMIPVNQEISEKMRFSMLKPGMLAGYNRKARGRVLRADTIFQQQVQDVDFEFPFAEHFNDFKPAIRRVKDKSSNNHLYIEYTVK
jgi:hypothetical protein